MKKILALMSAVLLLSVSARAVEVSAPSAVLMEKETGTVLFAKNEHEKLEPASVTKIMTLLLTMEAIDGGTLRYEDTVTASPHACSMGGSQIWLKEGEDVYKRQGHRLRRTLRPLDLRPYDGSKDACHAPTLQDVHRPTKG